MVDRRATCALCKQNLISAFYIRALGRRGLIKAHIHPVCDKRRCPCGHYVQNSFVSICPSCGKVL